MKRFHYKAYDETGKLCEGEISGVSWQAIAREMYDREWRLVRLTEQKERGHFSFQKKPFSSRRQWALLASEWSTLLDAGLTVTESLHLLENQMAAKEKQVLQTVEKQISSGHQVWESFQMSQAFPPFFISLLQVGEMTGTLPRELMRLSAYYEKEEAFIGKIKSALSYPLFVLSFALVVLVVILTYILPSFQLLFQTLQIDLPIGTRWALEVGLFLKQWGWEIGICFLVSLLLSLLFLQTEQGKQWLAEKLYGSRFYRRLLLIRFCLTLSALTESGKTLSEALGDAARVVGNPKAAWAITSMQEKVQKGEQFADALEQSGFSFPLVNQLCQVGMESGELPKFLSQAAYMMTGETEQKLRRFRSLLEPLLLLFVGGITALVLFSVMLPVFQAAGSHMG